MRRDVLWALGAVVVVTVGAWLLGASQATKPVDRDPRPSTLLSGPMGARGVAQILEALGTRVVPLRTPLLPDTPIDRGATLLLLAPMATVEGPAALQLVQQHARVPLVLAGGTLSEPMRCFGWRVDVLDGQDSIATIAPERSAQPAPYVRAVLASHDTTDVTLTGSAIDGADAGCRVPTAAAVDTLVRAADGRPVAVRLHYADAPSVTLAAPVSLFRNRQVRETAAAAQAVLITGTPATLVVDEEIHGFADGRSIVTVVSEWAVRNARGIAVLHAVVAGLLLLVLRGGPRAPPRPLPLPARRSSAEHVRALAAALAVAGGRVEAVRLLLRGLRRRTGDRRLQRDDDAWLADARSSARTAAARAALDRLAAARRSPTDADVLAAAQAANDFRHEMLP